MYSEKYCPDCERTLPASHFYPQPGTASGLYAYCRRCSVARNRMYRGRPRRGIHQVQSDGAHRAPPPPGTTCDCCRWAGQDSIGALMCRVRGRRPRELWRRSACPLWDARTEDMTVDCLRATRSRSAMAECEDCA